MECSGVEWSRVEWSGVVDMPCYASAAQDGLLPPPVMAAAAVKV